MDEDQTGTKQEIDQAETSSEEDDDDFDDAIKQTKKGAKKGAQVEESKVTGKAADEMKMRTPLDILKTSEVGWDKTIQEKVKGLIDENIHVLRQNYKDDKGDYLGGLMRRDDNAGEQGDGTQIRSYLNFVTVKVQTSDVIQHVKK